MFSARTHVLDGPHDTIHTRMSWAEKVPAVGGISSDAEGVMAVG
jgi:hypothetical protein